MLAIFDDAKVIDVKVVSNNVITPLKIALYNNDYYQYNDVKKAYCFIDNYKFIEKLRSNPLRFRDASTQSIRIELFSDRALFAIHHRLICFPDNQAILLKNSSFCSTMFAEYRLSKTQEQQAVDIVRESYETNGYPEIVEDVVARIKNNTFFTKEVLYNFASVLGFGSRYIPKELLKKVFESVYNEYSTPQERTLFFIGLACLNGENIANRIFELQKQFAGFLITKGVNND